MSLPISEECHENIRFVEREYSGALRAIRTVIAHLERIDQEFAFEDLEMIASLKKMKSEIKGQSVALKDFLITMDQEDQEAANEQGPTVIGARVIEEDEFA